MEDRSNIIKEAIEYRDKLEKKVEELAQSIVRLQISLDFADDTIKKKDKENAELKAENTELENKLKQCWNLHNKFIEENTRLKDELDYKVEYIQEQRNIIEDYKKEINLYKRGMGKRSSKREEKYRQTIQKIKEIAENFCEACKEFQVKDSSNCRYCNYKKVIQLINESEVQLMDGIDDGNGNTIIKTGGK